MTRKQRIAANCCYCNQGGYMTLAELGVLFWHDLAAPIAVGIITSAILSWWRDRK
ncbi:small toxic polypeptide [Kluyvera ascorbata ATCC 33433]|nr:small toxic polypeptide [Kluyvera ascorbata ATCC 33433]